MTIVALAGRKGSGKSTLSKYLIDNEDFHRISFADYLKELIINVFNIEKKYLYDQSLKETKCLNIYTDLDFYQKISRYINEDITYLHQQSLYIDNPRYLLQFVGTDILRKHDLNFHVKKTLSTIVSNKKTNFVCDDLRFQNELEGLRSINAEEYFVIRPNNWNISNHESETSIHWFDINSKIINNSSLDRLIEAFRIRQYTNQSDIIYNYKSMKPVLQFDLSAAVPNDAFIGGFICAHKIKNNLKELELNSIKEYLLDLSERLDYLTNDFKLENLKNWLDPNFPPNVYVNSWQRGQAYYQQLVS